MPINSREHNGLALAGDDRDERQKGRTVKPITLQIQSRVVSEISFSPSRVIFTPVVFTFMLITGKHLAVIIFIDIDAIG